MNQALGNTGWTLKYCETFYEADGVTEKIRSLKSENKRGAYALIADICKLSNARPVFDGDDKSVTVVSLNRYDSMMELNFGKNLSSVERKEDAANVVTRLYVEGEYSDNGYVGIDDVNPTGLPFLLNFDYFRELGIFTATHEQALADYLRDIQTAKAASSAAITQLLRLENQLNELWGQIDYVLYVFDGSHVTRTILGGDATEGDAAQGEDDTLALLFPDGTHRYQTGWVIGEPVDYVMKFLQKAAARIGGKEVAVEAKEKSIESLKSEYDKTTDEAKKADILVQIAALRESIAALYEGTETDTGLYALMRSAVLLAVQHDDVRLTYQASLSSQQEIENAFALAMGDMLIDGYWSNTNYAPGQEELLYNEACEVMAQLSKPAVTYTTAIQNLSCVSGYEIERFQISQLLRIWDEALALNDQAYISKLVERLDAPEKDSVTITNDLTSLGSVSFDNIISQITGIAENVRNKKALYDRAQAIGSNGSIPAQRLEGMIDVLKTRLSSAVSNWYTDADGNLILESVNGASAMKLCGEGFMIASSRTDDGAWDWRTFGTGEGFTADMLITGFLSADRIRANSITANKLAADVGETLDLSSNMGINLRVQGINANIDRLHAAAVSNVQVLYALGSSSSTAPIGGWSAEAPDWADGMFMWQKTVTTYANGTTDESDPTCLTGTAGEAATTLRIDSSRGTVFKNSNVSTVLSAVIYHGSQRITDITALRNTYGAGAYLQWSWQRMGEDRYGVISADDARLSQNGFQFTLSAADVDTKVTFMCE